MCDSFKFITVRWFNLILFIYLFIWQTCKIQLFSKRFRHLHNFSKQTHSPIELSSQAPGSLYICQNTEVTAAPIVDTTTEMIWKPIDAFTWNEELKDEILDVPAVYVAKKIELFYVYDANTWNNSWVSLRHFAVNLTGGQPRMYWRVCCTGVSKWYEIACICH
jgi:hypothetical protein